MSKRNWIVLFKDSGMVGASSDGGGKMSLANVELRGATIIDTLEDRDPGDGILLFRTREGGVYRLCSSELGWWIENLVTEEIG